MKVTTGTGTYMLVALVQSQQTEPTPKEKGIKFIDFKPLGRKKREYKKP